MTHLFVPNAKIEDLHPTVPFDDHYQILVDGGLEPLRISHVGPHTNREMNLMKAGVKPMSSVTFKDFEKHGWEEFAEKYGFTVTTVHIYPGDNSESNLYVTYPGELWRALTIKSMILADGISPCPQLYGMLLGYTNTDIAWYMVRQEVRTLALRMGMGTDRFSYDAFVKKIERQLKKKSFWDSPYCPSLDFALEDALGKVRESMTRVEP